MTSKPLKNDRQVKPIARKVAIIFLCIILTIIILELVQRFCYRDKAYYRPDCVNLINKYIPIHNTVQYLNDITTDLSKNNSLSIDELISLRVILADRGDLLGANGVACFSYAFVSRDLPESAQKYVALHEVMHLLGEKNETKVNYLSASHEPIGFVRTMLYSVMINFQGRKITDFPCSLANIWRNVKIYFLNLDNR